MADAEMLNTMLEQFMELEEDIFLAGFHQQVQKGQQKAWHDHHIKLKDFQVGDLVLMYYSKFQRHPRKLKMHWLGPYRVEEITNEGAVIFSKLNVEQVQGYVNGSRLKPYKGNKLLQQG